MALTAERDRLAGQLAAVRARQLPADVCGATDGMGRDDGVFVVCTLPPHSVELLPEGHPMHRRFHQDWRDGRLWAEWSSVTDDDVGRLWPDGHIGRRSALAAAPEEEPANG
jgi:hypothetical protein